MIINDVRSLAYTAQIGSVMPIAGADNIELVTIGGWTCIAKKGEFEENDYCVYFEIDSKLPETAEWAAFLAPKKFKVKTMKLSKFGVISQGLVLPYTAFTGIDLPNKIHQDVTELLGVTYCDAEDNKRKANSEDKYKKMAQRRPDIFKKAWAKWFMRREWGRKLMFTFFGKKKDKKNGWPQWVKKTDEERCQNLVQYFTTDAIKNQPWIVTEKVDGTSTTFTMKRGKLFSKPDFRICSRNVVFDKPDKNCFYDTNVYVEMAEKYNIEAVLTQILADNPDLDFVTLQGETYGDGIQRRTYGLKNHDFAAFNLIYGWKNGEVMRFNPDQMKEKLSTFNIPCVPIIETLTCLPNSVEEMLAYAEKDKSAIDGGMREGVVLRTLDGKTSFKSVSNPFLLKYHS